MGWSLAGTPTTARILKVSREHVFLHIYWEMINNPQACVITGLNKNRSLTED